MAANLLETLSAFVHDPVHPAPIAAFRILIGCIAAANALSYLRRASLLLDPDGLLPFDVWRQAPDRHFFSLLRWLPATATIVRAVIAAYALAGLLLAIGLFTIWSAAAVFVLGISLNHRNRFVLHSGDAVMRVLTFLLIFAHSGSVLSVDAWLRGPVTEVAPWAFRLMQLQVALLYLQTALFKLPGKTWREGTATHYASRLLAHRRRRLPTFLDVPWLHRVATAATLLIEAAGGTLIWWEPARLPVVLSLALLHLTLNYLLRMHIFQWVMLAALALFVPAELLVRVAGWVS